MINNSWQGDKVTEQFQMILSALAAVVWLVRLEGKILAQEKANVETQKDVDGLRIDHSKIADDLARIRESLGRIEGAMLSRQREES